MSDAMVRGYASLPFSQALVEEYSGVTSSDGELSAPSNGNPTQLAYLPLDRMTAFCRVSRFGMTFKPLTADRGEELLTLYLADFPAKTSQQPGEAQELTEPDPECGHTWQELLARYDRSTSLWKTPQCSLLGDYTEFSETWPRWGLMQDGVSYQRQTLVRPTSETESGLWRTPQAQEGMRGVYKSKEAMDAHLDRGHQLSLSNQVVHRHLWPTPTAHNAKETNAPSEALRNEPSLASRVGGTLNPTWVEWLMGWPLGWTDLKPLEMDKFQQWRQQHGIY
jgi:hypothetical protein